MSPELSGVIAGGVIGFATAGLGFLVTWLQHKSSRAFGLRRDIYVDAAAAMAGALQMFSRAPDLNVTDEDLAMFVSPATVAMFKIHVVASPPTVSALSSANQSLTQSAVDLSIRRALLRQAVGAAEEDGTPEAQAHAQGLKQALLVEAFQASLRYQRHLAEVNLCARKELGLPIDEEAYRASNRNAEQAVVESLEQGIRAIEGLQPNKPLQPTSGGD